MQWVFVHPSVGSPKRQSTTFVGGSGFQVVGVSLNLFFIVPKLFFERKGSIYVFPTMNRKHLD